MKNLKNKGYYFLKYFEVMKLQGIFRGHIWDIPERDVLATLPPYQDSANGIAVTLKRMHKIPLSEKESRVLDEVILVIDQREKFPAPPKLSLWSKILSSYTLLIILFLALNLWILTENSNHDWDAPYLFFFNILFIPIYFYLNAFLLSKRLGNLGYNDIPFKYCLYYINHLGIEVWQIPKHEDLRELIKHKGRIDEIYLHDIMMSFKKYNNPDNRMRR